MLITLGIIGVVATITMPVLISNVQDRVKQKRVENIKQKLSKVTDTMSSASGINGYSDTMSFVQEMNRYMKIAKICDNSNLSACWGSKEVTINKNGKMWEMSKTKDAKSLLIPEKVRRDWMDTVGIVTADGTPIILSYNKNCDFNPDTTGYAYGNGLSNSASCLSGAFDWNGGKKPNKLGDDVLNFGVAMGLGECSIEIDGKCFSSPFLPIPLTRTQCEEEVQKGNLKIKGCGYGIDYWAGAVKQCGGIENMPTMADLAKLASLLYKGNPKIGTWDTVDHITLDRSKVEYIGGFPGKYVIWSNQEIGSGQAYSRGFYRDAFYWHDHWRDNASNAAICRSN